MLQDKVGEKAMSSKSSVVFDADALKKELLEKYIPMQTNILIEYAKEKIIKLGDTIASYNGANGLDRTGNLLNSLCWGVTYDGSLKDSGFYRAERLNFRYNRWGQTRGLGSQGGYDSYLHEYFPEDAELVDGRKMALEYLLSKHGSKGKWTVFFAILAPYWGYWEGGFKQVKTGKRMQFSAMIYIYDDVRMDLKPAKTLITVYRPKYSYRRKKYKNRVGLRKITFNRKEK